MCNCKNKVGFNEALRKAKSLTKTTDEQHVVFYMPLVKEFFVTKESELNDELGICCYFNTDGTEVEYTPKGENQIAEDSKDESGDISDKDYKTFVDKGKVSLTILKSIAEKVKTQSELTERENAIFVAKTAEINELIAE